MVWNVEREIVGLGIFALRWYSLLFALGFVIGYFVMQRIFRAEGKSEAVLDSLLFHLVAGTVIGARLGHCLLYEPEVYLMEPLRILKIWEGGLASHGGFTGVIIAIWLFCRRHRDLPFFWLMDRLTPPIMLAAAFIRLGNLFNSEIIGKAAPEGLPWAVVFQKVDMIPRHPTQVYEALGYAAIAALLYALYRLKDRKPREGLIFGLVLMLAYGFRAFVEVFKENQVAFENDLPLNMGQLLSLPFVLVGLYLALGFHRRVALVRPLLSPSEWRSDGKEPPPAPARPASEPTGRIAAGKPAAARTPPP